MRLEHCKNGDIYEFISAYTKYQMSKGNQMKGLYKHDKPLLRSMFNQLIDGLSSMHNKAGYAHMDIKLENILISNEGHLKLCDFGFSTYASNPVFKKLGTEAYMAPEIHNARFIPCDARKADVFSLGILFFIFAFGAPPFHSAQ